MRGSQAPLTPSPASLAYALDEYTEVDEHARLALGRHEIAGKPPSPA
jgi:hypothetical protein